MTPTSRKSGLTAFLPDSRIAATTQKSEAEPVAAAPAVKDEPAQKGAMFSKLERKETRLRQDQLDKLNALTKQIKRSKGTGGERITDNTLIRVAVDLLLSQSDRLTGSTEAELRNSVTL